MDGLKVVLITCGSCGTKQLWNYETKAETCLSCESTMVLKTVSEGDLQQIKGLQKKGKNGNGKNGKNAGQNDGSISYSDYLIYKITPEEVERIKALSRLEKKQAESELNARNAGKPTAASARTACKK